MLQAWNQLQVFLTNAQLKTGEQLAQMVEDLADGLFFTTIIVRDELDAYRVFETLNARGVQLSAADLVKTYLFSLIDKGNRESANADDINALDSQWRAIDDELGKLEFVDFLRAYWMSRYEKVRHKDLFQKVRKTIDSAAKVFEFMRELQDAAEVYVALQDENHDYWMSNSDDRAAIKA
jgi:uncharacterized protein with ParB-like and HNH nuclease domain